MNKKKKTTWDHVDDCHRAIEKACKDMEREAKVAQQLDPRTAMFLSGAWHGLRAGLRITYEKMCELENKD